MKKYFVLLAILTLPALGQTTATMTSSMPVTPVPALTPVSSVKVMPASKASKNVVKKKKLTKKAQARMDCIKGNPKLRLAKHKKKLNRCIKRKTSPLL